jgi:hypothetical protein
MLLDYDGLVRPLVAIMRSPPTSVAEPFLKLPLQHPLLTPTNTPPGRQYCAQRTFKQRACREYVYWLTTATGEVCSLASAATWTETGSADYFQEEADSAYANLQDHRERPNIRLSAAVTASQRKLPTRRESFEALAGGLPLSSALQFAAKRATSCRANS